MLIKQKKKNLFQIERLFFFLILIKIKYFTLTTREWFGILYRNIITDKITVALTNTWEQPINSTRKFLSKFNTNIIDNSANNSTDIAGVKKNKFIIEINSGSRPSLK